MAGDAETGVTIIELVQELDAGPIAAQESFPIDANDDAGAVFAKAAEIAVSLLDDVLSQPVPVLQEQEGEPTYAAKITAEDRRLDLDRPVPDLVDRVRALSPTSAHARSCTDAASRSGALASATTGPSSRSRCSPTEAAA